MKMSLLTRKLIIPMVGMVMLSSCTGKRPTEYNQGSGLYLQQIDSLSANGSSVNSAVLGVKHELTTTENKLGDGSYSDAQHLTLEAPVESLGINDFSFVEFITNSPYLDGVPFRGRPSTKYEIRYGLSDKFFNVYKVAESKDIPQQERPYATILADGRLMVPVVGYPITYVKVEAAKDAYGNESSRLMEIPVQKLSDATHYRINVTNRNYFDPIIKENIFPASIFNPKDEWFFAATIVSAENKTAVGQDLSEDSKNKAVSRVKFILSKDFIKVVNLNISDRLRDDEINYKEAITIPVKWMDFRRQRSGTDWDYKTEVLVDGMNEAVKWDKRAFVQLVLKEAKSAFTDKSGTEGKIDTISQKLGADATILTDLKLSDELISFTLDYTEQKRKIRYVLKKAHAPVVGKTYFEEDRRKFGFFSTTKDHIEDSSVYRKEDLEKLVFLNRYYPKNGEIKFYFTNISSRNQAIRDIGREAIRVWNEAFLKAGTNIKITLDEQMEVDLGDIRYNAINLVDSADDGSLLGYGPSIVDTMSGEIIGATANIYVNPLRETMIFTLRNYVKSRMGAFSDKYIHVNDLNLNITPDMTAKGKAQLQSLLDDKTIKGSAALELNKYIADLTNLVQPRSSVNQRVNGSCDSYATNMAEIINDIKEQCPEIEKYIGDVKSLRDSGISVFHAANELPILRTCAERLIGPSVLGTLVHEMGHNLGLRHNFHASYDKENFYDKSETEGKEVHASSVMEYMPSNKHELMKPGSYDIAAIRFGYSDSLVLADNSLKKIDTSKPISANLSAGEKLKSFLYCTDEDISIGSDPTCQRHDWGTTPEEIVKQIIIAHDARFAINYHRYDRPALSSYSQYANALNNRLYTYQPLKQFYNKFRFYVDQFVGQRYGYLENFDSKTLKAIYAEMEQDAQFGSFYKLYKSAADLSLNYLNKIAFLPNMYCVFKSKSGYEVLEFSKLQEELFKSTNYTAVTCHDQALQSFAGAGLTFVKEVGHPVMNVKNTMDPRALQLNGAGTDIDLKIEILGSNLDRIYAMSTIGDRGSLNYYEQYVEKNSPNMIDESINEQIVSQKLFSRLIYGVSYKDLELSVEGQDSASLFVPYFDQEKSVLTTMFYSFVKALAVPGKTEATKEKLKNYRFFSSGDGRYLQGFMQLNGADTPWFIYDNTYYYAYPKTIAANMIEKRKEITEMKLFASIFTGKDGYASVPKTASVLKAISQLSLAIYTSADLMKLKTSDFIDMYVKVLPSTIAGIQKDYPNYAEILSRVFETELSLAASLNTDDAKKKYAADLSLTLGDFMTKNYSNAKIVFITQENAAASIDKIVNYIQSQTALYLAKTDELDVQSDTLIQIMDMF